MQSLKIENRPVATRNVVKRTLGNQEFKKYPSFSLKQNKLFEEPKPSLSEQALIHQVLRDGFIIGSHLGQQ